MGNRLAINRNSYEALIEPDAPALIEVGAWARYMGVRPDHVRKHMRMGLIPVYSDHIGPMLANPAWHVMWRDKDWNGHAYVYVEGLRSGCAWGEADPRVGSRTTGLPSA